MNLIPIVFGTQTEQGQASDLFFNYPHEHFDALNGATFDEMRAAIQKDANEFCEAYGGDAVWFTEDFMRRL